MANTLMFLSFDAFDAWTQQFEECSDWEMIPTAIDDGWKLSMDLFTACKSWKTALKRFAKAFKEVNPEVAGWVDCIRESCENGSFQDATGCRPAWTTDPDEIREFLSKGAYSWGVEQHDDKWYVFLNISGSYLGRKRIAR